MLAKLKSRKLWVAIGSIIVAFASGMYVEAMQLAMAYLAVEGIIDTAGALKRGV